MAAFSAKHHPNVCGLTLMLSYRYVTDVWGEKVLATSDGATQPPGGAFLSSCDNEARRAPFCEELFGDQGALREERERAFGHSNHPQ